MDKRLLFEEAERIINGEQDTMDPAFDHADDPKKQFLRRTELRLIKNHQKYMAGQTGKADYLAALRNFLLVYNMPLRIKNAAVLKDNQFGIYLYDGSNRYMAAMQIPSYIPHPHFVEDAFVQGDYVDGKFHSSYSLQTSPFISKLTGFSTFKSVEQKLSVYGALNTPDGYTTLICMSTGGGKSLISMAVAYASNGLTIVVVPTVSLALDQRKNAKAFIQHDTEDEVFCYYGGVPQSEKIFDAIRNKTARLLFISPEALLKNKTFKQLISNANDEGYLKNLIIDEAHIVIEWGDLFRVDYQCLEPWRNRLIQVNSSLRTFLLSATFEDRTVKYLKQMFSDRGKWLSVRCDSLRKEPRFIYLKSNGFRDKRRKFIELVNLLPHPMIIYTNSPDDAARLQKVLSYQGYSNIRLYTGNTRNKERDQLIQEWSTNEFDIMIGTSAFGVGVDKPDVRTVLHVYVPESPDTYYQELGRGGRDGLPCLSVMCLDQDEDIAKAMERSTKVLTTEKFVGRWWTMFKNDKNIWINNRYVIDTSVKPDYDFSGEFIKGNSADEKWNINVLLMMRRANIIAIDEIDEADQNYQITIRIMDNRLTTRNKEMEELFEEIRNEESSAAYKAFNLLRRAILYADSFCWSDMFTSTYSLVSDYCAGCNAHEEPQYDYTDQFPLHEAVRGLRRQPNDYSKKQFSSTNEMILITPESISDHELMNYLEPFNISLLICNRQFDYSETIDSDLQMMIVTIDELNDLMDVDEHFYLSGTAAVIYSKDVDQEYRIIQKFHKKYKEYLIHIASQDWYVNHRKKNLSEIIDGAMIRIN